MSETGADDLPNIGQLIRVAEALDSLFEMTLPLGPLAPEDKVTVFNRVRSLGITAIQYMTEEQSDTLKEILHPDFFDKAKELTASSARASLAVLRGYVHGCISELNREAQITANAEAYAEREDQRKRGVGFR